VDALRGPNPPRLADAVDDWLVGTPDDVISQIQVYRSLGVTHFMLWFIDFPSLSGPRLFAERVLPALQGAF
jgi:alkanesulfonate monooxygenase SsuD/methylene tetrahydromethanopterin reductase-like flavin-dependent oxidoreductase (luciferase family)